MISKRYALFLAIEEVLNSITVNNGYQEDLHKVYRGRTEFGEQETDYYVSLVEDIDHRDKEAVKPDMELHVVPYLIQGFVKQGENSDFTRAYQLLADIQKALRLEKDSLFSRTVTKVSISPGSVTRPIDSTGTDFLFVLVRLNITLAEDFEPFNS